MEGILNKIVFFSYFRERSGSTAYIFPISSSIINNVIPVGIELDMRILKNSDCLVYRLSELPVLCEEQYKKMTLSQQEDTYGNLLDTLPPIHEFSLGLIHYLADGMPCKKCFSYYIAIIPVHKWLLFYIRPWDWSNGFITKWKDLAEEDKNISK